MPATFPNEPFTAYSREIEEPELYDGRFHDGRSRRKRSVRTFIG